MVKLRIVLTSRNLLNYWECSLKLKLMFSLERYLKPFMNSYTKFVQIRERILLLEKTDYNIWLDYWLGKLVMEKLRNPRSFILHFHTHSLLHSIPSYQNTQLRLILWFGSLNRVYWVIIHTQFNQQSIIVVCWLIRVIWRIL